jgi:multisubunit Na+/H+ antiporter MnhG subunit
MSGTVKVLDSWVLGEFATPDALVAATRTMRESGFQGMDTYSPYPLHGGSEALGLPPSKVPFIALGGALTGMITALAMQTWMNSVDYPLNVGGRPLLSLPAWIPITFELSVLFAAFGIFFGLLGLSRLPQPYHPVFESEAFNSASTHGYWLSVPQLPGVNAEDVMNQLRNLGATQVTTVTGEKE